jgi:hypothetical protein
MGTGSIIDCAREGVAGLTPKLSLVVAGLACAAVTGVTISVVSAWSATLQDPHPAVSC